MKSFLALHALTAVLLPAVLAAPSLHTRRNTKDVKVVVQFIKETSEQDIAVVDKETSELLGYSCSNKLDSGAFANHTITANLDFEGAGNITVGPNTYQVHEDPEISGGIKCARIFNDVESFTTCAVPLPSSLALSPLTKREDSPSCFSGASSPGLYQAATYLLGEVDMPPPPPTYNITSREAAQPESELDKRFGPPGCPPTKKITQLVGDGNPHQNGYETQLSENLNCGAAPSCSVTYTQSKSYTIQFSVGAIIDEWITGGFAVSKTWDTGNNYLCGGSAGDTVCVWYNTAHTAYTVQNFDGVPCSSQYNPDGGSTILWSPNTNNVGGGYYCVIGACRSQGSSYWNYNGRAGGP